MKLVAPKLIKLYTITEQMLNNNNKDIIVRKMQQ